MHDKTMRFDFSGVARAFEQLGVAFRRATAAWAGHDPYRAGLRGPRRFSENRAAQARRRRELVYLNRRARKASR